MHHNIIAKSSGENLWLVWMRLGTSGAYNYAFQFKFIPDTEGIDNLMTSETMLNFLGIPGEGK